MSVFIRDAVLEDADRLLDIYAYYVKNTAITFAFILIIAGLFLGYDAILNQVVKLFKWLADLMK